MVRMTGERAHAARLRQLQGPAMVRRVGAALFAAGNLIEVEAALSITQGATSGKHHVPSAPGEPPNADTHLLDRSIETNQVEPLKVEVSANAPYAVELELGTSKMAARPYMRPAVAKKRKDAVQLVRRAVNQAIRSSKGA